VAEAIRCPTATLTDDRNESFAFSFRQLELVADNECNGISAVIPFGLTVLAAVVWKVELVSGDLNCLRDLEDHTLFSAARHQRRGTCSCLGMALRPNSSHQLDEVVIDLLLMTMRLSWQASIRPTPSALEQAPVCPHNSMALVEKGLGCAVLSLHIPELPRRSTHRAGDIHELGGSS